MLYSSLDDLVKCNGSIIQTQVAGRHLSLTPGCVVSTSASRLASGEPLSAAALERKGSGFGGSHRQAIVAIQPRGMLGGSIPSPLVTPTVTLDDPSSAIIARGLPQLCRSCNPPHLVRSSPLMTTYHDYLLCSAFLPDGVSGRCTIRGWVDATC